MSALPRAARIIAGALRALSRASLPLLAIALVRAMDPPITPDVLARALFALALVPELCAKLMVRAFAADVRVEDGTLRIAGGLRRLELPSRSLARASAWRLPLPSAGLALTLRSGERLPVGLAARDLAPLLGELAGAGVATPPPDDPALVAAAARAACPRRCWDRGLVKIGLASLLPGAIAFNAHQHIAYGSFLGEYYLMGLRAWLGTAGGYWLTSALYLVLWAGCFRIAVEAVSLAGASLAPALAGRVRGVAERTAAALYYASIPLLLALRFLA